MTNVRSTAAAAVLALVLPLSTAAAGTASAASAHTAAVSSAPAPAPAAQSTLLALPRPTGPYRVGEDDLHLVDVRRQDPWVPSAGPRQLMVSMYYPARAGTGRPAPYMTTAEAQDFLSMEGVSSLVPAAELAGTLTYAYTDARPEQGRYPLVLLSPGFTLPRETLTGLATDLASRGYVVALVDHTYEDSGTTFPDGRTLTCAICGANQPSNPAVIADSRAKDLSFVIDELTGRDPAWQYARMIDAKRIGIAGHSLGGDAAATTMAADPRVRAGVNMDGTFWEPAPAEGVGRRPFLLLGNPTDHSVGSPDTSWDAAWTNLDGWKRWLTVTGTVHTNFTDVPLLATEAGIPTPGMQIPALRAMQLTRTYVAAFFDLQLKGIPQPLLDGPSAADPEVVFQHP